MDVHAVQALSWLLVARDVVVAVMPNESRATYCRRDLNLRAVSYTGGTTIAAVACCSTSYLSIWRFNRVFNTPLLLVISPENRLFCTVIRTYWWSGVFLKTCVFKTIVGLIYFQLHNKSFIYKILSPRISLLFLCNIKIDNFWINSLISIEH